MSTEYKAIKGLGTGRSKFQMAMRVRLYEGLDHLLLVQSTGYSEEYRRVFYHDIRYVVALKSNDQAIQAIISGILFGLSCLLFLAPWKIVAACVALPFLLWFIVNYALGPTCRAYISTEVQTLELPTPRRMNRVSRLTDFLKTRIAPEQPGIEQAVA